MSGSGDFPPYKPFFFVFCCFMIFMLFLYGLGLTGCSRISPQGSEPPFIQQKITQENMPTGPAKSWRIALVMKTLTNPFFIDMEKGARRAEKELGLQLIVKTAAQETSTEQQIEIVEALIKEHVDAIVIAPGDSEGLIPVLKEAQDAGIIIINIDNRLNVETSQKLGLKDVPFISVDNEKGAYLSAKYVSDQIKDPAQAGLIEGIRTAKNADDRKKGALQAFQENANIEVVAQETAHWKIDEAYAVTKTIFQRNPEIKVLFCANDMMALGAIKYLQESHRNDVLVAGFDALAEAKDAIRNGTMAVTIDQQADMQGYMGVKYAVMALGGEELLPETMIDIKMVNRETLK